ncbi:PEP-CTERM sorting domain-containing protein [Sphingomonas panacisoli]|uniref:PEP-CTERM sorting domain-containing protein n=2 Tax=Sphingomonas panacisoli TaxID=1813879 RepID=A0A5B8LL91_9SPHN|nr:PEP-CTERM sorting domain-containing protein [Sphingomonas panacisoli]
MTVIDPTSFTLDFDLAAGSVFTLASWLYADDVDDGTVDFFNTAKVTGVNVSAGGSLASASGALSPLPGGGYGYPAAVSGVPEPATWAMMIMGFGLIGAAMRRRHATPLVLAA